MPKVKKSKEEKVSEKALKFTARNMCWTSYTKPVVDLREPHRYTIFGEEICPDTGRLHYQGYTELGCAVRTKKMQTIIGCPYAHTEKRRGTRDEAKTYCMKDHKFIEYGDWLAGGQGSRNDIKNAVAIIKETKVGAVLKIAQELPEAYVKFNRGFEKLDFKLNKGAEWRDVKVIIYYGAAGAGKSRRAREELKGKPYFELEMERDIWWDGYDGEDTVIIDDINTSIVTYNDFLKLTDGYRKRCRTKGGFVWGHYTTLYITSNSHPKEWYGGLKGEEKAAFDRRISTIEFFQKSHDVTKLCVGNTGDHTHADAKFSYMDCYTELSTLWLS